MRQENYMILGVLFRLLDLVNESQETMKRYASETSIEAVPSYLILGEIQRIKEDLTNEN